MKLNEHLSTRLRTLRAERNWSQENVAQMLKLSLGGYSNIENGKTDVSLSKLETLASIFGLSVSELLDFGQTVYNIRADNNNGVIHNSGTFTKCVESENVNKAFQYLADYLKGLENRIQGLEKK